MRKKTPVPRNKQSIPSKSGKKLKKELPKKDIVEFEFITKENKEKHKNGTGRLKIDKDGNISYLVFDDIIGKWFPVKAKILKLKLKTVVIRKKEGKG